MALTLRFSLLQYGHIRRTFSYSLLCRSLGTDATARTESSLRRPDIQAGPPIDRMESAKRSKPIQCFPNDQLKDKVNEEYRKRSRSRVWTVPNILTFSRIATTPAMGYFIWNGMHSYALTCFAFAAVTDLLDGLIARKFNQSSDLGAMLDPVADKLLLTTCFIAMYNTNMIPLWVVKGFVLRDVLIVAVGSLMRYNGLKEATLKNFFDFKNYPTIGFEPTFVSKCNTALQCLLIVIHLSTNHLVGLPIYDWSIFGLQSVTMFTTAYSLAQYYARTGPPVGLDTGRADRFKG